MVTLAPESLPMMVRVVCSWVLVPNRVFTFVAVMFRLVPITVLDTFVPRVVVLFSLLASSVLIPTPWNAAQPCTSTSSNTDDVGTAT